MPWVKCKICNSDFYAKPRHLKIGWGKYCSKACQNKSQFTGKLVKCEMCSQEVYRMRKELAKSQSKKYFCTKSCQAKWRNSIVYVGENHSNWRGGESVCRNIIQKAEIEQICRLCGTTDKRVLVVHHRDKNRKNNALKNLVWLCMNCHYLTHNG